MTKQLYLGCLENVRQQGTERFYLDSKHLCTHAICMGMTGSGKTGLLISLIEEAVLKKIPVIAVDPKGDLGNVALTFPDEEAEHFKQWIVEQYTAQGKESSGEANSSNDWAKQEIKEWRENVSSWHSDMAEVSHLRRSMDCRIYTPGSSAGLQLSVFPRLCRPSCQGARARSDTEVLEYLADAAASRLLMLSGKEAERADREFILLYELILAALTSSSRTSISELIHMVQHPPLTRIGAFDVDDFFPKKDRVKFALRLNAILASPWMKKFASGDSLDIQEMLRQSSTRTPTSILSLSHLPDEQRMQIICTLLSELTTWIREQSGTSDLKALLIIDEVAPYIPPVATPPSKRLLMNLIKQARASGLGIVLSTQNPGDVDYKVLTNAGVWAIGRLSTDRDIEKALVGISGAAQGRDAGLDSLSLKRGIRSLRRREFLLQNFHTNQARTFSVRECMCFLHGPLTLEQICKICSWSRSRNPGEGSRGRKLQRKRNIGEDAGEDNSSREKKPRLRYSREVEYKKNHLHSYLKPRIDPNLQETYLPPSSMLVDAPHSKGPSHAFYRPGLIANLSVHHRILKYGIEDWMEVKLLAEDIFSNKHNVWAGARSIYSELPFVDTPSDGILYTRDVPKILSTEKTFTNAVRQLRAFAPRKLSKEFLVNKLSGLSSKVGESELEFRSRLLVTNRRRLENDLMLSEAKHRQITRQIETTRTRYDRMIDAKERQKKHAFLGEVVQVGLHIISSIFGWKTLMKSTRRPPSAQRRLSKQNDNIEKEILDLHRRKDERLNELQTALEELDQENQRLQDKYTEDFSHVETIISCPHRNDTDILWIKLLWLPYSVHADGKETPLFTLPL